ncbi:accessory gene regulator ArgB-like protein [Caminicella sporogenes]|uniref:accessory gene regulator ArgB-like protein n=1 Tax=Caminicella sporogenes TaxID=166485 RepID=UPI002541F23E|nr:accessory gene regulator B family protein [Caminicella sporogenes]WIF95283.1 accessory gene regulator B family protein [Caminicella sporogenes]
MIKKLADNIAYYISRELGYDDEKSEILSYGLEIFLGTTIKLLSISIFAYFLNTFETTMIVLISFIIFRRIIGGTHCNTYNKCYFLSIFLILMLGILGNIVKLSQESNYIAILSVYIFAVVSSVLWVPAGTEKKMIRNKNLRKKIKIKTILLLSIWLGVVFYLSKNSLYYSYIFSSLLGVVFAFLFTTPLGYRLINFKQLKMNLKQGGE